MKRIILLLLIVAGAVRLNAQQVKTVPDIKLNNGLQNTFKPNAWFTPQMLLTQSNNNHYKIKSRDSVTFYSTMPIAKVSGNDRMPVASGNNNMVYTMPVLKVGIVNPLAANQKPQR